MPEMYLATGRSSGDELSSTYEGRHLSIEESLITHPYHSDGLVDGGEPVVIKGANGNGNIVGVAFKDAAAVTDFIAIDTEGIWFLTCTAVDDAGNSAIEEGDPLYINNSTCIISKIENETYNIPFGYSLGDLATGTTGVVAVKVHWDPDPVIDRYRYLSATDDAWSFNITDVSAGASGLRRGLYVNYLNDGDKTGSAEVDVIGADLTIQDDLSYAYCIGCYVAQSGNPAIGQIAGLSVYLDDPGTACDNITAIDLGLAGGTNSPSGRHTFIRMRNHSAGAVPDAALQFEGTPNADYFASWETVSNPVIAAAIGGAQTHKIRIRAAGIDYFIPLHTA